MPSYGRKNEHIIGYRVRERERETKSKKEREKERVRERKINIKRGREIERYAFIWTDKRTYHWL